MANNINDYKNRMTAPIGVTRINPKTGKPLGNAAKKSGQKQSVKRK